MNISEIPNVLEKHELTWASFLGPPKNIFFKNGAANKYMYACVYIYIYIYWFALMENHQLAKS